tara:strand:- start:116 stop:298 length:183 start_codon:yes stop_codon:yes gene_type:complete
MVTKRKVPKSNKRKKDPNAEGTGIPPGQKGTRPPSILKNKKGGGKVMSGEELISHFYEVN